MEEERKVIFTNTTESDETVYRQLYRRIRRGYTWFFTVLAGTVAVILIGSIIRFTLLYASYGQSFFRTMNAWILLLCAAYLCFGAVFIPFAPRRLAKKYSKRLRELNNDRLPTVCAVFYAEEAVFQNAASKGESSLRYTVFTKMQETDDLFLLWTKQKQVIPLAKNGFDGIDAAGFRAFMDEKCPQAKRNWSKGA